MMMMMMLFYLVLRCSLDQRFTKLGLIVATTFLELSRDYVILAIVMR